MRRPLIYLVLLGLATFGLTGAALAAPTVTFKPTVVPIKGFPGTGYKLGAGAALEAQITIKGTESTGGVPSQLRQVVAYLPKGATLNPAPFVTCTLAVLESDGPEGCPKGSAASPIGVAGVVDPIGGELVKENATVQGFFAPGGGLNFYSDASAPISAQIVARAHVVAASGLFGQKVITEIPLIESVPGAPAVSTVSINVKVGSAVKKGHKVSYYGRVPKTCPKGGFPEKVELTFQSGETVTVNGKLPCPRH